MCRKHVKKFFTCYKKLFIITNTGMKLLKMEGKIGG